MQSFGFYFIETNDLTIMFISVVTERDAMAKVSSPFVVKLFYSMQSQQNIFLVYCIAYLLHSQTLICNLLV